MLFMRLHEYHQYLKPFVEYLNFMPQVVAFDDIMINANSIDSDSAIVTRLKEI